VIDRSRLAFLGAGYRRLRGATVSVVGAGGGGSHIAQQLAHLAVGTVPCIDPDILKAWNVNRNVGSNYRLIGKRKSTILADRLAGLGGRVVPVPNRAESSEGRAWLERSDLVFGAVDGARARENIERICRAALVPYIDIGLRIETSPTGEVTAAGGQIVVSLPGGPCLRCAEVVTDSALAADREEYGDNAIEQQVVSMNGVLASTAVTAGVALLTEYAPLFPPPPVLLYDGLTYEVRVDECGTVPCPHYLLEDAGWRMVLPKRKNVN
jgi:molybdopterin/thiamine biosynthesis adenylyltransferase